MFPVETLDLLKLVSLEEVACRVAVCAVREDWAAIAALAPGSLRVRRLQVASIYKEHRNGRKNRRGRRRCSGAASTDDAPSKGCCSGIGVPVHTSTAGELGEASATEDATSWKVDAVALVAMHVQNPW